MGGGGKSQVEAEKLHPSLDIPHHIPRQQQRTAQDQLASEGGWEAVQGGEGGPAPLQQGHGAHGDARVSDQQGTHLLLLQTHSVSQEGSHLEVSVDGGGQQVGLRDHRAHQSSPVWWNILCRDSSFSGRVQAWLMASTEGVCATMERTSLSLKPKLRSTSTVGLRFESTLRYNIQGYLRTILVSAAWSRRNSCSRYTMARASRRKRDMSGGGLRLLLLLVLAGPVPVPVSDGSEEVKVGQLHHPVVGLDALQAPEVQAAVGCVVCGSLSGVGAGVCVQRGCQGDAQH
eukprot:CAMPEP_0173300718 /NCGR_PEP_ID=MMETSP1143-20121109/17382_1 /TAXON_ID=483371 /ORGANISM="non described non described, Strain CCMP2298" /LENGTH=286 /DNA_ID=CAMNT_0014241133 /DNA_START=346 /DNA_END=1207 /DNA_ORIENTATION=-